MLVSTFVLASPLQAQVLTGRAEFFWALLHPFAALKVKSIGKKCDLVAADRATLVARLDSFSNGGRLDAFRHCFYMAAFAQKVSARKLRRLGVAHEKTNYRQFRKGLAEYGERPDSLSTVMDLANNETGFLLGAQHPATPLPDLKELVIVAITEGKSSVMKRNRQGEYLDCEGKPIARGHYYGAWYVPKCVVPSDSGQGD